MFRLTVRRLGIEPFACLMVDDQPQHLEGAQRVGLRTHVFKRAGLADLLGLLEAEGIL